MSKQVVEPLLLPRGAEAVDDDPLVAGPYQAIRLQDHSRWRPEWHRDRTFLWWYLTFDDQPELRGLTSAIQRALRHVDCLDALPVDWLHLTLHDVGFVDEVPPEQIGPLVLAATRALGDLRPLELVLSEPSTMQDALVLRVEPLDELSRLRDALYTAAAGLAPSLSGTSPEVDEFWPHVSLAYVNRECEAQELLSQLPAHVAVGGSRLTVRAVTLAAVNRVGRGYQWTPAATIPLGTTADT